MPLRDLRKARRRAHVRRYRHTARPLSGIRHLPATDTACVIRMKKLIYKQSGSHSRLENGTIKLIKRTQQRINMTFRAHVVSGQHEITPHRQSQNVERITPIVNLAITISFSPYAPYKRCTVKSASDNRGNVKWSRSRNRMSLSKRNPSIYRVR